MSTHSYSTTRKRPIAEIQQVLLQWAKEARNKVIPELSENEIMFLLNPDSQSTRKAGSS